MKITNCKIKKSIQIKLLEFFCSRNNGTVSSRFARHSSQYAILFYRKIRLVISHHLALQAHELFNSEVELDESYFGGVRKGKRGRGAAGKTAVFGMLKRHGKVYTVTVQDTKTDTLLAVIKKKIQPDSIVYTDCYCSYDLLDISEFPTIE